MEKLTYKKIFLFWMPLLATWLMMSVEGPYLTALIARMAEPEFNLAAYGVAFSIALIVESPVIMILSASVALVENKNTFIKLRNYIYTINLAMIAVMTVLILPPVFDYLSITVIKLPERVAHLTHMAVVLLIPWTPAIGYRRFYQGVLIKNNKTRLVAYGTVIRLVAMTATALFLFSFSKVHGVVVGAAALSIGVIIEAAATKLMALDVLKKIFSDKSNQKSITYNEITKFYYPLILTSFISLGVHPVVTFFMGQSRMPLESLAVLPVINALVFIFRAFGLSYQEVGIALMKSKQEYYLLRNFAYFMAALVVIGLGLFSATPLGDYWLISVAGLSNELAKLSVLPLLLYTVFPTTTVWINFQRSILVYARDTKPITYASLIEVAGIIIILFIAIKYFSMVGVVAAVIAYTLGRFMANAYLIKPFESAKQKFV